MGMWDQMGSQQTKRDQEFPPKSQTSSGSFLEKSRRISVKNQRKHPKTCIKKIQNFWFLILVPHYREFYSGWGFMPWNISCSLCFCRILWCWVHPNLAIFGENNHYSHYKSSQKTPLIKQFLINWFTPEIVILGSHIHEEYLIISQHFFLEICWSAKGGGKINNGIKISYGVKKSFRE